jgi:hypothetical protein
VEGQHSGPTSFLLNIARLSEGTPEAISISSSYGATLLKKVSRIFSFMPLVANNKEKRIIASNHTATKATAALLLKLQRIFTKEDIFF